LRTLDLSREYIFSAYPRTWSRDPNSNRWLDFQLYSVRKQSDLPVDQFSIRGQITKFNSEKQRILVLIRPHKRRPFYLRIQGVIPEELVGWFFDRKYGMQAPSFRTALSPDMLG